MEDLKKGQEGLGQENNSAPVGSGTDSTGNTDGWNASENKPYMRQLGKKFWGNETLNGFESLTEVVDDYLKLKSVPDKYDIEGADEYVDTFKSIGLKNEGAKAVMELINNAKPKKIDVDVVLKERHGDGFSEMKQSAEKVMKSFADEAVLKTANEYALMENPAFIEFAGKVAKAMGEDFHDFRKDSGDKGLNGRNTILDIAKRSMGIK